ncbi:MAG: hypothetical protein ABIG09_05115 [bacterium]
MKTPVCSFQGLIVWQKSSLVCELGKGDGKIADILQGIMKRLLLALILLGSISCLPFFTYAGESSSTGVGFQVTPSGISGISIRHWHTPKIGTQLLLGGWQEGNDYNINFGFGMLYKVRDKEKIDAYFSLGGGGYKDIEKEGANTEEIWEAYGIQGVFGVEFWFGKTKEWEDLKLNLEVGVFGGRDRDEYIEKNNLQWLEKKSIIGYGIGLGVHYYF